MTDDDHKLDALFLSKLEEYSPGLPEQAWDNILSGLERSGRIRRLKALRWAAAAAVLVFALGTGLWIQGLLEQPANPEAAIPVSGERSSPTLPSQTETAETLRDAARPRLAAGKPISANQAMIPATLSAGITPDAEKPVHQRITLQSLQRLPGLLPVEDAAEIPEMAALSLPGTRSSERSSLSGAFPASVVPTRPGKTAPAKESWKVGLQVQPAYASYSASYSDDYGVPASAGDPSRLASLGGGVTVQYQASPRWRLESGLNYFQASGETGQQGGIFALNQMDAAPGEGLKYYSSAVSLDNGSLAMNSTAGIIRFSTTPPNASLITSPETSFSMNTALLSPGEFTQVFDFMEIPLTVRYQLLDGAIDVEIFSGINTNLLFGNKVYMDNLSGRRDIGTTRDISTFSFSGLAGMGFSAPIAGNFSFSLEPRASYFLSSLNHSGEVDFRPWRIAVFSGISYQF